MEWSAENYTIDVQDSKIEASLKGARFIRIIRPAIVEMSAQENKKQIDLMNEKDKYGASNLTYDTNILILYTQYGPQDTQPSSSVEVVIDIVDNNARVAGIRPVLKLKKGTLSSGTKKKANGIMNLK